MPPADVGTKRFSFNVLTPEGGSPDVIDRSIIIEAPIAIEYNGIGYAVMMATPIDLVDFGIGFSLSEQLIDDASQIEAISFHHAENGWVLRIQLAQEKVGKIVDRARQRVSESSCGLCGMENLDEVMRPLPLVTAKLEVTRDAIFSALEALRDHQTLNAETGACHAAAFCSADGSIRLAREDVGRHNALDKLLGAMAQGDIAASEGFILLTARCSFELAQKAILANCSLLVTISAATDLAIESAAKHNLSLISLARRDSALSVLPQN